MITSNETISKEQAEAILKCAGYGLAEYEKYYYLTYDGKELDDGMMGKPVTIDRIVSKLAEVIWSKAFEAGEIYAKQEIRNSLGL